MYVNLPEVENRDCCGTTGLRRPKTPKPRSHKPAPKVTSRVTQGAAKGKGKNEDAEKGTDRAKTDKLYTICNKSLIKKYKGRVSLT